LLSTRNAKLFSSFLGGPAAGRGGQRVGLQPAQHYRISALLRQFRSFRSVAGLSHMTNCLKEEGVVLARAFDLPGIEVAAEALARC
jgi:hypothetical protein